MCGIAGIFGFENLGNTKKVNLLNAMISELIHRGPDSDGIWIDPTNICALGHRRLAIQDLSEAGSQPMISSKKRFAISFNGEIYNHVELRSQIRNIRFKGTSDTETLICLIEKFGIKHTLNLVKGQFAFSLFDTKTNRLYLCRDRMGEKPIYYSFSKSGLIFGSELKALKKFEGIDFSIDKSALSEFVNFSYISAPKSIYKGIRKVKPGSVVTISSAAKGYEISEELYWNIDEIYQKNTYQYQSIDNVLSQLESKLENSVRSQLISDVSLGSFLSGGVDSSLITSIMSKVSANKVKTFTVGFQDQDFNEAPYARKIANHLGTDHTEVFVNTDDLLNIIPNLSDMYDEPFADSSQLPTALISSIAKNYVTVILSGDGADELFGGYNRYKFLPYIWDKFSLFPKPVRQLLAITVKNLRPMLSSSPLQHSHSNLNNKLNKLAFALYKSDNERDFFEKIQMTYNFNENPFLDTNEYRPSKDIDADLNTLDAMMLGDLKRYLPGDILCKVDRASMFHSLETRAPYLDRDLVEYAINIPNKYKVNDQGQKILLTNLLSKYLDRDLFQRPKSGFAIPLSSWLKGPLKSWVLDLLSPETVSRQGFFNVETIQKLSNQYFRNNSINTSTIWNLVIFQSWLNRNNF